MVLEQGIGTKVAGYFPMDADPCTKSPTLICKINLGLGALCYLAY